MPQHPRHDLHHRPAPPQRSAGGALVTALRAAVSLLELTALLAGLPLLLWWGTEVVAPSGIAALGNLLSTQDSGQVFLLALAVAGWIGWALFALSVLVEIPAQLRGRTAPQLRLLIGQRTAAALVGAILLALPTGTALAASATPASASPPSLPPPGPAPRPPTRQPPSRRRRTRLGRQRTPCAPRGRPRACGRSPRHGSVTATGGRRSPH